MSKKHLRIKSYKYNKSLLKLVIAYLSAKDKQEKDRYLEILKNEVEELSRGQNANTKNR